MLTLSGAPDRVVSWFDFSFQHENVRKLKDLLYNFFKLLPDLSF